MIPSLRSLRLTFGVIAVLFFAGAARADMPQAVPEPATTTVAALAGAGVYLLNRRRRR